MHHTEVILNQGYTDVNPVVFGYESCEKGHSYGPAIRTYWLLHFVASGKGKFVIGDRTYPVTEDSLFVIPPFVETYYEADGADPWEYIWVGFTASDRVRFFREDVIYLPEARRLFEGMRTLCGTERGTTERICAYLWELFSFLQSRSRPGTSRVAMAESILRAELSSALTVSEVAARVGMDRSHFSTLFKRETGLAPKEYLQRVRLEEAARLLSRGHSVTVTALSVGYGDVYVFSKMFKRRFGVSPSEYKKKLP
ncbi:MAG: AraC family transcriptional regulator [Clostridia bacterium]|nr:AraC family transcriptional regulator [Clostridia bacterium]